VVDFRPHGPTGRPTKYRPEANEGPGSGLERRVIRPVPRNGQAEPRPDNREKHPADDCRRRAHHTVILQATYV